MNETRVFADGYRGVFQKQEDFLECLKSIGRNSFIKNRLQSKKILHNQGREAPHFLTGLSSVFEKKVGDFLRQRSESPMK